jgi:hypothetical protein
MRTRYAGIQFLMTSLGFVIDYRAGRIMAVGSTQRLAEIITTDLSLG